MTQGDRRATGAGAAVDSSRSARTVTRLAGAESVVRPGTIVLLNGTSSSGKTTLAAELLAGFDTPWFHLAVDDFGAMRSVPQTAALGEDELAVALRRTRAGFHRAVAGMAAAGNDVVVDLVLSEPWRLLDCLTVFTGHRVVFVGLHCSAAELDRRESARGDRTAGQAAAQLAAVHAHGRYDLEFDTETTNPTECARQIRVLLARPAGLTAFDRLRADLTGQSTAPDAR